MDELFKLLKEYIKVTGKNHHLLVSFEQGVSLIQLNDRTLEIGYYHYLGNLNTKDNEPARTLEGFIRAVKTVKDNRLATSKALWGEE